MVDENVFDPKKFHIYKDGVAIVRDSRPCQCGGVMFVRLKDDITGTTRTVCPVCVLMRRTETIIDRYKVQVKEGEPK